MALTPEEEAQAVRLASYNERPVNPATNPGGIGRGGNTNFFAALKDFAGFGKGVVRVATDGLAELHAIIQRFESAVAAIQAGPVTSVRVGNGPAQSGAVVVDLSTLSADVETALEDLRAAQALIEARAASTQAYTLAFGG